MSALPEPWRSLSAEIRKIKEQLRRMGNASPFFGTGMHPNGAGGIDSDNYVTAVSGYSFGADGNAEFNDVTLRGILVGLDTPVKQESLRDSATGFSLTTSYVEEAGFDVTVPDGCTRVQAVLLGKLFAFNANTSGGGDGTGQDALYVRVAIGGSYSTATPTGISGNGGFATTNGDDAFTLTGLTPGASLHVSVEGQSGYATIPADVDNYTSVVASLTWLR